MAQLPRQAIDMLATMSDYDTHLLKLLNQPSLSQKLADELMTIYVSNSTKYLTNSTNGSGLGTAAYTDSTTTTVATGNGYSKYYEQEWKEWNDASASNRRYRARSNLEHYDLGYAAGKAMGETRGYERGIHDLAYIHTFKKGERYAMPDGSVLAIDNDGNYTIDNTQRKTTHKQHSFRGFNPYMNASDLLEEFFEYLASQGVTQRSLTQINIRLFVAWMVVRAAEADGEATPDKEMRELVEAFAPKLIPQPVAVMPRTITSVLFDIAMFGWKPKLRREEWQKERHAVGIRSRR